MGKAMRNCLWGRNMSLDKINETLLGEDMALNKINEKLLGEDMALNKINEKLLGEDMALAKTLLLVRFLRLLAHTAKDQEPNLRDLMRVLADLLLLARSFIGLRIRFVTEQGKRWGWGGGHSTICVHPRRNPLDTSVSAHMQWITLTYHYSEIPTCK